MRLDWTAVHGWPNGEDPEGATPDYVVSRSADRQSVLVRDGDASEVLFSHAAADGFEVNDVFLDPPTLVVVHADPGEEKDDRVVVINLRTQNERELAGSAPDAWMGSWSLGEHVLTYGARGPRDKYCLAAVDRDTLDGDLVECVPPRHGLHQVKQSPFGFGYSRFDDSRPVSCNTARVRRGSHEPVDVDGPADCKLWEALPADDGVVWSEVPRARQIEVAEIFVRTAAAGTESLGYGTTGSLTWCGDYVWFTRQTEGQIMRWSPDDGLETAFEMPDRSKAAVLSAPVCSGTSISFTEASDAPGWGNREVLYRTDATTD